MDITEQARTIAMTFNATHGVEILKVVEASEAITEDEVRQLSLPHMAMMWMSAGEVFRLIRKRAPTHSEVIRAGHLLSSMGWATRKYGPTTFYKLDNGPAPSAD